MIKSQPLRSEDGWVMVPVIVLMVVAMGIAFALLAIVDTQTGQSREQRSKDSAQTLAEGAVSSTANILASSASGSVWKVPACETITGNLTDPSAAPGSSFAAKLTSEMQSRFSGSTTTWRVDVCPWQSSDARWTDSFLTRGTVPIAAGGPGAVWVRGQATVRSRAGATTPTNTRAVASKVRQNTTPFTPPANIAVGTGAFSTDVGVALNNTTSALLAGGLTKPLIAQSDKKVGVRCGLLNSLNNLSTTCVTGSLAGASATTNALGLGVLASALGIDRVQALSTWSMAPADAIDAWLTEAKTTGIYSASVSGVGNIKTKSIPPVGAGADCFSVTPTAAQVIFIDQVGNGDQYCNVRSDATAKILIVRRGGVRISAHFTGVVYMLNQQECTNADGTCSTADRTNAVPREVVRIEGNTGHVTGSVWADGAGGAVGIYPSLNLAGTGPNSSLLALGGANGICSLPGVGPVLNLVGTTLNSVVSLVNGGILPLITGVQEEVRYPGGGAQPTGCDLLKGQLGGLTTSQLANVFGTGAPQTVVVSEHRTRTCKKWLLVVCTEWNAFGPWTTRDTQDVNIPALLNSGTPSLTEQVAGVLGATLNNYTAIDYDSAAVTNATAQISQGAAPVIGTYRNAGPVT